MRRSMSRSEFILNLDVLLRYATVRKVLRPRHKTWQEISLHKRGMEFYCCRFTQTYEEYRRAARGAASSVDEVRTVDVLILATAVGGNVAAELNEEPTLLCICRLRRSGSLTEHHRRVLADDELQRLTGKFRVGMAGQIETPL